MNRYPQRPRRAGALSKRALVACMLMPLLAACTSMPDWLRPPRPRAAVLMDVMADTSSDALRACSVARAAPVAPPERSIEGCRRRA